MTIRTDVAPKVFIERLAALPPSGYTIDFSPESNPEERRLDIFPLAPTRHKGLFAQFTCAPCWRLLTQVNVRASRWESGDRPSYDLYVATAKEMVSPILRAYRAAYRGRCQMRIESKAKLEPKLPIRTKYFFDLFVRRANTQYLHESDWADYYHFIQAAHEGQTFILRDDLVSMLVKHDFSQEAAIGLADAYEHGRGLLKHRIFLHCYYPPKSGEVLA